MLTKCSHLTSSLIALVLIWSCEAGAAKRKPPLVADDKGGQHTTLRASRPSYLVSGRVGQQEVRYVSVQVTNIGAVVAMDVRAFIEGTSGLTFPLRGTKRLASQASGVYVSTVRVPSGVVLKPHVVVTCANCRR